MAYDEGLAQRLRDYFFERENVVEKKMFGGLAFMVNGNMSVGVTNKGDLMVRVGKDGHDDALAQPHARPMDFTGRKMTGFRRRMSTKAGRKIINRQRSRAAGRPKKR